MKDEKEKGEEGKTRRAWFTVVAFYHVYYAVPAVERFALGLQRSTWSDMEQSQLNWIANFI